MVDIFATTPFKIKTLTKLPIQHEQSIFVCNFYATIDFLRIG